MDTLEIHTLELGWYNFQVSELETASLLDRWLYWLPHAVGVLEMISRTPDQRRHYDARLKWELDENTRIQTAFEEGEARGEARVRIELIRTLEELLRLQISSDAELRGKSLEELQQRAQFLQEMIRNHPSS